MKRFALALTLAIAGTVSARTPTSAADGCGFVSAPDVAKALGVATVTTKNADHPRVSICTYRAPSMIPSVIVSASKAESVAAGPAEFSRVTEASATLFGEKPKPIAGSGDQAASVGNVLWVRKGVTIFSINAAVRGGPSRKLAVERAVAVKLRP